MRVFIIATFIATIAFGAFSTAKAQGQLCGDRVQIQRILTECREALAELKGMNAANPNTRARQRNALKIRIIKRQLRLLRAELSMSPEPETTPVATGPESMSNQSFTSLLEAVDGEGFDKGKLRVIREAAGGNFFTVMQLRTLMRKFSFADGKVKAAAALHTRLVDPGNFSQVYQELSFDGDKKKLRKLVGK